MDWEEIVIVVAVIGIILLACVLTFGIKLYCDRVSEEEDIMTFVRGTIVYIQDNEITVTSGTEGKTKIYLIHSTHNLYLYDEIFATVEDDSILVFKIGDR